jgi:hypothetical protein
MINDDDEIGNCAKRAGSTFVALQLPQGNHQAGAFLQCGNALIMNNGFAGVNCRRIGLGIF